MEVVKVQLHATKDGARALIYPQGAPPERTKEQKLTEPERRLLAGDTVAYCKGSWVGGRWKLGRRVRNQEW